MCSYLRKRRNWILSVQDVIRKMHAKPRMISLFFISASVGTVSVVPDPDSTTAESESADPESERASASENPQPTGQKPEMIYARYFYDECFSECYLFTVYINGSI